MPEPGRDAEEQRADARQSLLQSAVTNPLAVAVMEAKASKLPGQVNGPADAYRHLVRVGEMARRWGPNNAGRSAELHELHELQGSASEILDGLRGKEGSLTNSAAAAAMDRRNNLLGVSIGQQAATFDDVLRLAREAIDRSPRDGSGGVIGAVWLPRDRWLANPAGNESEWNWPRLDWSRVPDQHVRNYGWRGERHRFTSHHVSAAERRAALAAEKRADWTRLLREEDTASDGAAGGPVQVRAHQRDGHPVRAHTRAAP